MIQIEENPSPSTDITDSVARLAGYIAAGEIYISLKPEIVRIIKEENRGDAYGEFKRIEQKSHRRWLGMDPEIERTDSLVNDQSIRKVGSGESVKRKSVNSELSRSSASLNGQVQIAEKGDATLDKVQLRREVGAWWGKKAAN